MEEKIVVDAIKNYLRAEGWRIMQVKPTYFIRGIFLPDIAASKDGKILSVECKGSIPLDELLKGIGQCVEHQYYGSDIICLGVPEDTADEANKLTQNLLVSNGKVGLLVVKNKHKVKLQNKWKEIKPLRNDKAPSALTSSVQHFLFKDIENTIGNFLILNKIKHGIDYPYLIIKDLRKNKCAFISKMTKVHVYSSLIGLEKQGLINSNRKFYGHKFQKTYLLTSRGRKALEWFKHNSSKMFSETEELIEEVYRDLDE